MSSFCQRSQHRQLPMLVCGQPCTIPHWLSPPNHRCKEQSKECISQTKRFIDACRHRGHRPCAVSHGRHPVGSGSPALLCELAAGHLPHTQRQHHQCTRAAQLAAGIPSPPTSSLCLTTPLCSDCDGSQTIKALGVWRGFHRRAWRLKKALRPRSFCRDRNHSSIDIYALALIQR